jgi:release factor glutamine methyltransferase
MENQPITLTDALASQLSKALFEGARRLRSGGIDTDRLDAELLLGHILGLTREQLMVGTNRLLCGEEREEYEDVLRRRLQREPVAYITGRQEFWSLDFDVTPDVLIPRPETERLVEIALKLGAEMHTGRALRILDIGTGSGAIAIALASEVPAAEIFATDVFEPALVVARSNAVKNRVSARIQFRRGDLFEAISDVKVAFDLILANPPYIRRGEIDELEPEVSEWEPRGALDGGVDGLDFYRRIAAEAFHYLGRNGAVVVEMGADMGTAVAALFENAGDCGGTEIYQDYSGKDRTVVARKQTARTTAA